MENAGLRSTRARVRTAHRPRCRRLRDPGSSRAPRARSQPLGGAREATAATGAEAHDPVRSGRRAPVAACCAARARRRHERRLHVRPRRGRRRHRDVVAGGDPLDRRRRPLRRRPASTRSHGGRPSARSMRSSARSHSLRRCESRFSGSGRSAKRSSPGCTASGWTDIAATVRREERVTELRERYGVEVGMSNADAVAVPRSP